MFTLLSYGWTVQYKNVLGRVHAPTFMSFEICKLYLTKEIKLGSKKASDSSEILNEISLSLSLFLTSEVRKLIFFASHFIISLTDVIITHILVRIGI